MATRGMDKFEEYCIGRANNTQKTYYPNISQLLKVHDVPIKDKKHVCNFLEEALQEQITVNMMMEEREKPSALGENKIETTSKEVQTEPLPLDLEALRQESRDKLQQMQDDTARLNKIIKDSKAIIEKFEDHPEKIDQSSTIDILLKENELFKQQDEASRQRMAEYIQSVNQLEIQNYNLQLELQRLQNEVDKYNKLLEQKHAAQIADIDELIKQLTAKIASLKQQSQASEENIAKLQQEIQTLEKEQGEKRKKKKEDDVKSEASDDDEEGDESEPSDDEREDKDEESNKKLQNLKDQLLAALDNKQLLEEQIESDSKELNALIKRKENFTNTFQEQSEQKENEIKQKTDKIEKLQKQLLEQTSLINRHQQKIDELNKHIQTLQGIVNTKVAKGGEEAEIIKLTAELNNLKAQKTKAEQDLTNAQSEITTLKAQATQYQTEINKVNATIQTLQDTVKQNANDIKTLTDINNELQVELDERNQASQKLDAELEQTKALLVATKKTAPEGEEKETQKKITTLEQQITALEQQLVQTKNDKTAIEKNIHTNTDIIKKYETDKLQQEKQLAELQKNAAQTINDLKGKILKTEEALREMTLKHENALAEQKNKATAIINDLESKILETKETLRETTLEHDNQVRDLVDALEKEKTKRPSGKGRKQTPEEETPEEEASEREKTSKETEEKETENFEEERKELYDIIADQAAQFAGLGNEYRRHIEESGLGGPGGPGGFGGPSGGAGGPPDKDFRRKKTSYEDVILGACPPPPPYAVALTGEAAPEERDLNRKIYLLTQEIEGLKAQNIQMDKSNKLQPIFGLSGVGILIGIAIGFAVGGFVALPLVLGACIGGAIGAVGGKFVSSNMIEDEKANNILKIASMQTQLQNAQQRQLEFTKIAQGIEKAKRLPVQDLYANNIKKISPIREAAVMV